MKKLLFPLLLLALLLGVAYWLDRRDMDKNSASFVFGTLSLSDIKEIHLTRATLQQEKGAWYAGHSHYVLDPLLMEAFWEQMQLISVKRLLDEKETSGLLQKDLFKDERNRMELTLSNGLKQSYSFGARPSLDEGFYLLIEEGGQKRLVIATHQGKGDLLYQEEKQLWSQQYGQLKTYLHQEESAFYDRHLLKGPLTSDKIDIENSWNRPFSVFLQKRETFPPLFKGPLYDEEQFRLFGERLKEIRANQIFLEGVFESDLEEKSSTLTFDQGFVWTLYKKYKGRSGYFVTLSQEKGPLFELDKSSAFLFFYNVQDFWQKQLFAGEDLLGTQDETFSLSFDGQHFTELKIPLSSSFEVKVLSGTLVPRIPPFRELFQFLVGVGERKAHRMSDLDRHPSKIDQKMIIRIRSLELLLYYEGDELVIFNQTQRYRLHYLLSRGRPFTLNKSSFFY